jgi:ubiquinone biosynthesis protein
MTAMAPPPLPDLDALAVDSAWMAGRVGLDEELLRLRAHADRQTPRVAAAAARLASPRASVATLLALLRTLFRFCWFAIVSLAGEGMARRRHRASRGTVWRAQQLVAAGGPAYVKVGQSIATAQGLLPEEWVEAFAWCRDEVPPMPPGSAEQAVAAALGAPLATLFASFDPVPKAAASIAQVHYARLHDGTEVVVKVQRPGLRKQFTSDIRVMALLTAAADRVSRQARMSNVREILPVFAELVLSELDFRLEALNMVHVGVASEDAHLGFVRVPRPIPGMITASVLVMERVPGVPYTAAKATYGDAVDGGRLLRLAAEGVLEHALMYGVFHGDLHSGNVLVTENGDISLVDFGITGRITARERALLVRLLLASMQRDCRAQIATMAEYGALPADVDLDGAVAELERYNAVLFEFTDSTFEHLDFTLITRQLRAAIGFLVKIGFKTPKELALFSRNLLYLNGFAAALAPDQHMFGELDALLTHMMSKYPVELTAIMLGALTTQAPDQAAAS